MTKRKAARVLREPPPKAQTKAKTKRERLAPAPVCEGCGGSCQGGVQVEDGNPQGRECDGVIRQSKFAGRAKTHCCLMCKRRAQGRRHYNRYRSKDRLVFLAEEEGKTLTSDQWEVLIRKHKSQGHQRRACPAPMPGRWNSCWTANELWTRQSQVRSPDRPINYHDRSRQERDDAIASGGTFSYSELEDWQTGPNQP